MLKLSDLELLSKKGIVFLAHIHDITIEIKPKEVNAYVKDPDSIFAQKCNVSKQKWLAWKKYGDWHQCPAITTKGIRCKKFITQQGLYGFTEGVSEHCAHHRKHGIK